MKISKRQAIETLARRFGYRPVPGSRPRVLGLLRSRRLLEKGDVAFGLDRRVTGPGRFVIAVDHDVRRTLE